MAPLRTSRRRFVRVLTGAALALLALRALSFVAPRESGLSAPAPLTRRHAVEAPMDDGPADDGRVLDGSGIVGSVGALVLAIAVLPYVALSIYSAVQLATQGQAIAPVVANGTLAPTGVLGLGEGVGVLVVFGVSLWSILSLVIRGAGLPAGPFSVLGLTQTLSFVGALAFAAAGVLNGLGEDNPVRGISLGATPAQLQQVASKSGKLFSKSAEEVVRLTAEPRAELEAKLKEVEEQASTELAKTPAGKVKLPDVKLPDVKLPDVKTPDVKLPDVKMPDVKMPDVKLPEFKMPDIKMPDVKMPAFKVPELKAPGKASPAAPAPEVQEAPATQATATEEDLFD
ncbi:PRX [Symbiodinium natans]|uniref:PRX protein n=1 Tax=Symbiodinium natans TaxID=878477 RepID=A0A812U7V2_9DINO|nr:PRX [Symbiodinium natans]